MQVSTVQLNSQSLTPSPRGETPASRPTHSCQSHLQTNGCIKTPGISGKPTTDEERPSKQINGSQREDGTMKSRNILRAVTEISVCKITLRHETGKGCYLKVTE